MRALCAGSPSPPLPLSPPFPTHVLELACVLRPAGLLVALVLQPSLSPPPLLPHHSFFKLYDECGGDGDDCDEDEAVAALAWVRAALHAMCPPAAVCRCLCD